MIVARERKGLKIQGARSADRRRHTRRHIEEGGAGYTLTLAIQPLTSPVVRSPG